MTTADQKIVQEATKLTFEEFVALDREVRAKAATVLADANVEYLTSALPLVDPGFTPEVSEELYRIGIEATPDAIKAAPTTPLIQGWNRDLTAIRMAATGNPSLLVHAKMIAAGSAFFTGPQDNHGVWDHKTNGFPEMISRLTIASASRKDTGELYPLSSTVTEHTSASDMSYAANLNYPDLDGKTLYNLRGTVITLADGTEMFVWQKYSSSKAGDPDYGGVMNDPDR
ncbi:MAG TPA: hypothetical protein DEG43_16715 [Acidimicrobiaceae bacterium]|nr:hypothetical protein [Acidimicrobiaceae bacterium]